jgi:hypothetical protein
MALTLPDDFEVPVAVAYEDRYGHPAAVDVAPQWASSDEMIATVVTGSDPASATIVPATKLGAVQISVRASDDGKELIGLLDVEVVPGTAITAKITPGTPTPRA